MTTGIEWTDETWNPVTGCTKISEGCRNCYAERMARRLAGRCGYPEAPHHFDVTLHPDKLDQPLRWKKPRRVFVCSMGDLFHEDVPLSAIAQVFGAMEDTQRHTFQVLTKRPDRMMEYAGKWWWWMYGDWGLPNVWIGVSTENQEQADRRIPDLLQTPAAVRFVSVEPMLSPMNLAFDGRPGMGRPDHLQALSWVIIGCESGPNRRPMKLEWALDLVRQCDAAGVATFVKQIPINGRVSHDPTEWPAELQRREYPK